MIPSVLKAYQLLEVAPWSSVDEVKRAYRAKAMQHHPDRHQLDERGHEMARLNLALEAVRVLERA